MPMLTNLADVLRAAGCKVQEVGGWKTRGHGAMNSVKTIVHHHTAGAATGNYPSLNVVTYGRPGLEGPLCNLGVGRDGTWYVVAAGVAWHAGSVRDSSYGNAYSIGIENENTGTGQAWPSVQVESMARGTAALCKAFKLPVSRVLAHKEVCYPVNRKIDPAYLPGDMSGFRSKVNTYMTGGGGSSPAALTDDERLERGMALSNEAKKDIYTAVWFGAPGAKLINGRMQGEPSGWPEYFIGSLRDQVVRAQIIPLRAQITALTELVSQLSGDREIDLEAIEAASARGAQKALEEGVVDVDVTIAGKDV